MTLLRVCGDAVGGGDPVEAVQVIRAEKRLQALDFWLRNPDYLADELITAVEGGGLADSHLDVAEALLTDPEPAWHHYPMPKWFFGAYESVDDAFALLDTYGLAFVQRRGAPPKRLQNSFFLTQLGVEMANELTTTNVLDWYPRQATLVHLVAGNDSGSRLKERQYAQEAYAMATWGQQIGSIGEQVVRRLAELQGRWTAASASASATPDEQQAGDA